ncbi:hypothetical protein pdam_00025172 [Pocillopora damicornis]|uniref:PHD-type domain-containing protein n=1 Tax=Pocillopora damicornis TaxID=46731 RepID=A0A3M6TMK4_POCDA|nr:hypothetical protein pdam_00025172 [Pocillopora damicornis]
MASAQLINCIVCDEPVRPRQQGVQCDGCLRWSHRLCNTGISQEAYRTAVTDGVEIDWLCAACAELTSEQEYDSVAVPDSPPPSSPIPASPTPVSPTAPSPTSSPLPVSPTAASPVAVELSLDDPDPAEIVQQPNQLTFTIIDDATLKRKRKLVDNDGYTYNVKRQCVGATHWQCTVRPKVNIFFP